MLKGRFPRGEYKVFFLVERCKISENIKEKLIYGEFNQRGTLVCTTSGKVSNFILKFKHFDICFILIYANAAGIVSRKRVLH
jgi:hypothetical protein